MEKEDLTKQKIHLSGDKYLVSDGYNIYIAQEVSSKKSEKPYLKRLSGFHTDYEHAFESYFMKTVKGTLIEGEIKDLVELIKKTRAEIRSWYRKFDKAWRETDD